MKNIALILVLLINTAFAGDLIKVKKFKSKSLESLRLSSNVLVKAFSSDMYFNTFSYAFKNRTAQDAATSIVKKEYNDPYSIPEYINVIEIRKSKFDSELSMILEPFAMYARLRNEAPDVADFNLKTAHMVLAHKDLSVLALAHGNMFGESVGVVIFDQQTRELIIMERVYSE